MREQRAAGTAPFVAVLAGTMAIAAIVMPSLGVLATFVIDDFGLDRAQFGWLVTSLAAVTAVCGPLAGRLVDRVGGRRVIVGLLLATAAGLLLIAAAPGLSLLVPVVMLAGLPNAASNPAANSLIANRVARGAQGLTMGVKQSGVQLGIFAVGITLPALALRVGWRGALVALAVSALLVAALAAAVLPPDGPTGPTEAGGAPYRHPTAVRWITAYAALMGASGSVVTTFFPLYAQEALSLRATVAGGCLALIGLLGIASRIAAAKYVEQLAHFEIPLAVLAGGGVVAIALLLLASLAATWLVWPAAVLAGVTLMAWNAVANLAAISLTSRHEAGRASGMINLGFMAGYAVGPAAFGSLVDAVDGYSLGWSAVLLLCLSATGLMGARTLRRQPRTPPEATQPEERGF